MSEGLAQGLYVVTRVGFELATLQMQGTELTTEPLLPHSSNLLAFNSPKSCISSGSPYTYCYTACMFALCYQIAVVQPGSD